MPASRRPVAPWNDSEVLIKDQYVGDVNDFFKYALLRSVQKSTTVPLVVCWMATPDDGGRDGRKRQYLSQAEVYRAIDPELFEAMARVLSADTPSLSLVESEAILPGAAYYGHPLSDSLAERESYFRELFARAPAGSVIFFDPDNGLEIKSRQKGRKGSSKFLYLDEIRAAGEDGRSLIVYQHFGRVERVSYIATQLSRMAAVLPSHDLSAISGSHVGFLVATAETTTEQMRGAMQSLVDRWPRLKLVAI